MTLRETGVSTAMDISDGLLADLGKLCAASDVGADIEIDLIPADSFLKKAYPGRWKELSVTGGEDYELLFTAGKEKIKQLTAAGNLDFSVIGTITGSPKTVRVFDGNGKEVIYQSGGWDHFRDPT
jgi:thiamine-monophosphate kinase